MFCWIPSPGLPDSALLEIRDHPPAPENISVVSIPGVGDVFPLSLLTWEYGYMLNILVTDTDSAAGKQLTPNKNHLLVVSSHQLCLSRLSQPSWEHLELTVCCRCAVQDLYPSLVCCTWFENHPLMAHSLVVVWEILPHAASGVLAQLSSPGLGRGIAVNTCIGPEVLCCFCGEKLAIKQAPPFYFHPLCPGLMVWTSCELGRGWIRWPLRKLRGG